MTSLYKQIEDALETSLIDYQNQYNIQMEIIKTGKSISLIHDAKARLIGIEITQHSLTRTLTALRDAKPDLEELQEALEWFNSLDKGIKKNASNVDGEYEDYIPNAFYNERVYKNTKIIKSQLEFWGTDDGLK